MIHDFRESLAKSASQSEAPFWLEVYRKAFPNLESAVCVRDDGWAQRGGIDRVLTLSSGKTITVDEKLREKAWDDILLEYWSDRDRKVRGWVAKDLACDFIAYAFAPSQKCYLLPTLTLRSAWRNNALAWVNKHPIIEAQNKNYVTVSCAIPIPVLMDAMKDAMCVTW